MSLLLEVVLTVSSQCQGTLAHCVYRNRITQFIYEKGKLSGKETSIHNAEQCSVFQLHQSKASTLR